MGKKLNSTPAKIVFDVDDVLWPLGMTIVKRLGIEPERYFYHFKVIENAKLSKPAQEAIIAAFADVRFFQEIEFFPGIREILEPRELGAVINIKSNCFSEQIADLKIQQLLAAVPGLTKDDIEVSIIDYSRTHAKAIDTDTTIFVDDSPYNVATSPARVNIMPDLGGWNNDASAKELLRGKTVFYAQTLDDINQLIYAQLKP